MTPEGRGGVAPRRRPGRMPATITLVSGDGQQVRRLNGQSVE